VERPYHHPRALLDSGSSKNLIDMDFLRLIGAEPRLKDSPVTPILADGSQSTSGAITHEIELTLLLGNGFNPYCTVFDVMPLGVAPIILGIPFFRDVNPQFDFVHQTIIPSVSNDRPSINNINILTEPNRPSTPSIPPEYSDFSDVFDEKEADVLPPHRPYNHRIPLIDGHNIPSGPIYSLSVTEQAEPKKYIEKMLRQGYIRPSESSFASPILFVKKKDGSLRLCVDYRRLNSITVKNKYPLPLINDMLDQLRDCSWFTSIDLRGAYNLLRIAEGEEHKTAFRTRLGLYKYMVMPFGLTNAPATFQHLMNDIFRDMLDVCVIIYLDDILIFSQNRESHVEHVREVLRRLREYKLYAKLEKCKFSVDRVGFLGYTITPNGVEMDAEKAASIRSWPEPKNLKELRGFLGFINFYRRFIKDFSKIATPLHNLTKKDAEYVFGKAEIESFESLKDSVSSAPILRHFDPSDPIIVETNASDFALGAIISQTNKHNITRPVAFASRKMSGPELNYPVLEKEFLAILFAFQQWRQYLEGPPHPVVVYTDHRSLEYFLTSKQLTRRQARWSEYMGEFNLVIKYRPGSTATKPDSLSQRADYKPSDTDSTSLSKELNGLNYRSLLPGETIVASVAPLQYDILEEVKVAYANDPEIDHLRIESANSNSSLVVSPTGLIKYDTAYYIPESMRTRILLDSHDAKHSGHPGRGKTYEKIKQRYWWPGMRKSIFDYVDSCHECQRTKVSRQKPLGYLMPLPAPERPWQHVTADFIVQLPQSEDYENIHKTPST
jgi:hypothetical protein